MSKAYRFDLIDTLLLSHLYTLIRHYDIRSGAELRQLGLEKLVNTNALDDIMSHQAMYSEISLEGFKHTDEMRDKLLIEIKKIRDGIN